jgi:hypothetical protein
MSSRRAICRTAFAGGLRCFAIASFPRRSIALIAAFRFNAEPKSG